VLASALRLVGLGVALGLLAAFSLAQWIQSQLHGVTATDPATYVGVTVAVFAATAAAASIPARRASRVDPMVSLRAE
jgi:ABC-type antimicrobial peptide transport system permease subunit